MTEGQPAPAPFAGPTPGYYLVRRRERAFLFSTATGQVYPLSPPAVAAFLRGSPDPEELRRLELEASGAAPLPVPTGPAPAAVRAEVEHALQTQVHQIVLGLTENCNLRCHYCVYSGAYAGLRRHSRARMPWEVARRAIDYLLSHRAQSPVPPGISFYGGEPLLELPLVRRCAEHARARSGGAARFVITTNGTLLDKDARAFLVEYDFTVIVSLDGPPDVHDRYRRTAAGRPTFETVMAGLEALREEAPGYFKDHVRFSVVLSPPIDYGRLTAFFDNLGLPCVVSPMETYGLGEEWLPRFNRPEFEPLAAAFERACRDRAAGADLWRRFSVSLLGPALRRFQTRADRPATTHSRLGQCVPGVRKIFVNPRGELYPCEKVEGGPEVSLGRIDRGVDPEAALALLLRFTDIVDRYCGGCWMRPLCCACLADAVQGGRFDPAKLDLRCAARREAHAEALGLYAALLEDDPSSLDFLPAAFPWG